MCGIFGIINDEKKQAAQTVLDGLKKLEYRGYDSWGIALKTSDSNEILLDKHIGKIGNAVTNLPTGGTIAIGHTRWATHGGVTDANAHVENYQELQSELRHKKHQFISETDTEVIAHLIEEEAKTKPLFLATLTAFKKLVGSNAIVVLDGKTGEVVVCRNGSPVVLGVTKETTYIASDATALLDKTNTVYFMDDNEAAYINKSYIELFSIDTEKAKKLVLQKIDWKAQAAEKGGFAHFALKEISEQSTTIPHVLLKRSKALSEVAELIKEGYRPIMIACGSASYCGLAAQYVFADLGIDSTNYGGYEYAPFARLATDKTLVFAISQSGETADTILAVKEAKKRGAKIVGVINAQGSTLERLSDYLLPVEAGPEIAVVSTKAFTAQLATFFALHSVIKNDDPSTFINEFSNWIQSKELHKTILDCAKHLLKSEHIYLIGKHINYPSALEFALKLKETSYIHAESFASGELKHGVISLIQPGTPCIVLTAHDDIYKEVISSAIELKSRGGMIIGVGPDTNQAFDFHIKTHATGNLYSIFYNVVVGQLLGYFVGVGRGADPDKPRNLAKSVTVK
ncbi:MAG: glutamine--fructose-6-phosphate transaminase (isomerizing) [Candidatus Roizmanbacteria bacterium]|nr:glutamine--fructose-6-phosphate transaminase (isomerizing) [Candidatus Roizmanbacteria bacterium]